MVRNENLKPESVPLLLHLDLLLLFQVGLPLCSEVGEPHLLHHQLLIWTHLHLLLDNVGNVQTI